MNWTDWETITVRGRDFAVMAERDDAMGEPWEDMIAAERHEATERAAALSMGIPTVGAR